MPLKLGEIVGTDDSPSIKVDWKKIVIDGNVHPHTTTKIMYLIELRRWIDAHLPDLYLECMSEMEAKDFEGFMRAMDPQALKAINAGIDKMSDLTEKKGKKP